MNEPIAYAHPDMLQISTNYHTSSGHNSLYSHKGILGLVSTIPFPWYQELQTHGSLCQIQCTIHLDEAASHN